MLANRASAIVAIAVAVANRYRVRGDATWYGPGWTAGARCRIESPRPPYNCKQKATDQLEYWTNH